MKIFRPLLVLSVIVCLITSWKSQLPTTLDFDSNKVGSFSVEKIDTSLFFEWSLPTNFKNYRFRVEEVFNNTLDTILFDTDYGVSTEENKSTYFFVDLNPHKGKTQIRLKVTNPNNESFYTSPLFIKI